MKFNRRRYYSDRCYSSITFIVDFICFSLAVVSSRLNYCWALELFDV